MSPSPIHRAVCAIGLAVITVIGATLPKEGIASPLGLFFLVSQALLIILSLLWRPLWLLKAFAGAYLLAIVVVAFDNLFVSVVMLDSISFIGLYHYLIAQVNQIQEKGVVK